MARDSILDRLDARLRGDKPQGVRPTREEALERIKKRYGKHSTTDSSVLPIPTSQPVVVRRRDGESLLRRPVFDPDGEGDRLVQQVLEENRERICGMRGDESSVHPNVVGYAADSIIGRLTGAPLNDFTGDYCAGIVVRDTVAQLVTSTKLIRSLSSSDSSEDDIAEHKPDPITPPRSLVYLLEEDYVFDSNSLPPLPVSPPLPDLEKQLADARSTVQRMADLERRSLHAFDSFGADRLMPKLVARKPEEKMVEIKLWKDDGRNPGMVASARSSSETPPIAWKKVDVASPLSIGRPKWYVETEGGLVPEGPLPRSGPRRVVRPERYIETGDGPVPVYKSGAALKDAAQIPKAVIAYDPDMQRDVFIAYDPDVQQEEPSVYSSRSRAGREVDVGKDLKATKPKTKRFGKVRAIIRSRLARVAAAILAFSAMGTGLAIERGQQISQIVERKAPRKNPVEIWSGGESVGYLYGERLDPENAAAGRDKSIPISPEELIKPDGHLYFAYQALMALEDQGHEGGLTDWVGVNPFNIARGFIRNGGGGSSMADQTCNAMQELLPYQFGIDGTYGDVFIRQHRLRTKMNDTLCGMGLATTKTPEEIAALYFTYAYLSSAANGAEVFARLNLQLPDGIKDEHFTIAHQIIIAAAIKRPYASDGHNWIGERSIVSRANFAIKHLVDKGVITKEILIKEGYLVASQFDGLTDEQARDLLAQTLEEAVLNSKPLTNQQISATRNGFSLQPKDGYEYLVNMAVDEARAMFDEDFREEIAKIGLTSNGFVQGKLIRSMQRELVAVNHPEARGVAVLTDSGGRIIAAFSGGKGERDIARSDGLDSVRLLSTNQMGSLGKLLLAAAVAHRGYSIHSQSPYVQSFRMHLMRSEPEIIADARRLGVTSDEIGKMIKCFGEVEPGKRRDYVHDAAMGMYYIPPAAALDIINVARTGQSVTVPHVIEYVVSRDGQGIPQHPIYPSADRSACASLIHTPPQSNRPGTGTWAWFSVPLSNGPTRETRGTLHRLNGVADVGKTGTYGKRAEDVSGSSDIEALGITNAAWVLVGTGGDHPLTGIFGIVARCTYYNDSDCDSGSIGEMINLESDLAGGNRPAEIARDTLIEAKKHLR